MTDANGSIVWFDIPVKDFESAKAFYGELLGWKFTPMGDVKKSNYWMVQVGKDTIGGLRQIEESIKKTDCPIVYFSVANLDNSISRAKKLGAGLVGERVDIGNEMGSYQWLRDKDGNLLGIWAHG